MRLIHRSTLTGLACALGFLAFSAAPALAAAPEMPATREAKSITGTTATLRGELNPFATAVDLEEEYEFAYAPAPTGCTEVAPGPPVKALGDPQELVSDPVTGLEPNRAYNFCVVAINTPLGGAPEPAPDGNQLPFKTPAVKPEVIPASESVPVLTPFEATLHAEVNANNQETTVYFQYSTSPAAVGGSLETPTDLPSAPGNSIGAGFGPAVVELGTGQALTPKTVYYYQAVAVNATGTSYGTIESFETSPLAAPIVESESASAGSSSATLNAQVNANYQTTKYSVEYSTAEFLGVLQAPVTTVKGTSHLPAAGPGQTASVSTGAVLAPSSTYYYRVVAENETSQKAGTPTDGPVKSFTTVPTPSIVSVSAITGTTATFEGSLAPLNEHVATKYYFEYNPGPVCTGSRTTEEEEPAGKGTGTVAAKPETATGLQPGTEYTVCFVTANEFALGEFGSQQGPPVHFTTHAAPPEIVGVGVAGLTPFEALLEASINPNGQVTKYSVEYSSKETSPGVLEAPVTTVTGTSTTPAGYSATQALVFTPETLKPNTTYYYRFVAENGTEPKAKGTVEHFTTLPAQAPVIEAESASTLTPSSETLEAQVNTGYEATSYSFQYAELESELLEVPSHGTPVAGGTPLTGSINTGPSQRATAAATGLKPGTKYYYRVLASNGTGSAPQLSSVASFTTADAPSVSTGGHQGVTASTATLSGTVNPGGLATSYYFQYGGTTAYGHQSASGEAGAGISPIEDLQADLTGLEPGVAYHYRIVAVNTNGAGEQQVAYGQDATFTTPSTPPVLSGVSVQGVTQSTATITATLEAQGLPTRWELQLGDTPGLLGDQASGDTTSTVPLSLGVGSLTPGTVYYYRLTAVNPDSPVNPGTNEISEGSFTTAPAAAGAAPPAAPALIPFQSIAELNAKEDREDKKLPNPVITKALTKAEKLKKALKACHAKHGKKRSGCEATAHKKFGPVKQVKK